MKIKAKSPFSHLLFNALTLTLVNLVSINVDVMTVSLGLLWQSSVRVDDYLELSSNGSSELHINYNLIYIQPHIQLY